MEPIKEIDLRHEFEMWKSRRGEASLYEGDGQFAAPGATQQYEAFIVGVEIGRAAIVSQEAAPVAAVPAPSPVPLFDRKLADLEQRGYEVIGRILHKDGEYALFDGSCRWLDKPKYDRLMHEQDGSLFATPRSPAAEQFFANLPNESRAAVPAQAVDALTEKEIESFWKKESMAGFDTRHLSFARAVIRAALSAQQKAGAVPVANLTCKGKGGAYVEVGVAAGAGTMRGNLVHVYRDAATGGLFFRTPMDFAKRMERAPGATAAQAQAAPDAVTDFYGNYHEKVDIYPTKAKAASPAYEGMAVGVIANREGARVCVILKSGDICTMVYNQHHGIGETFGAAALRAAPHPEPAK